MKWPLLPFQTQLVTNLHCWFLLWGWLTDWWCGCCRQLNNSFSFWTQQLNYIEIPSPKLIRYGGWVAGIQCRFAMPSAKLNVLETNNKFKNNNHNPGLLCFLENSQCNFSFFPHFLAADTFFPHSMKILRCNTSLIVIWQFQKHTA